ncbi:Sodium/proton antiporter nhaB [Aggregatibacter aphrophilus]|uniref:Sodium/proton antiporter nhaB n=1 Tax=Aggregatibacter aphrophilus TaxID=732 RepID=A0A336N919_AGGAP|nr:Sodium/proton antiporter nhaB [Aggregatibacter aphrophilus]
MDNNSNYTQAFLKNFLGSSPDWYKITIVAFLILNPILFSSPPFVQVGYWLSNLFLP